MGAQTGAFAQSTVTLTGGVSAGVMQNTIRKDTGLSAGTITRVAGSDNVTANSLYFSASEDLGGGMKVSVMNQQRFGVNPTGAPGSDNNVVLTGSAGGDMWVQVEGGFGTIKAGKFTFGSNAGYNTFGYRAISAIGVTAAAAGLGGSGDNILQYTTPDFNGFKVWLGAGLAAQKAGQDPAIGVRVTYDQGPLNLHVVHTSSINGGDTAADVTLNSGLSYPTNGTPTAVKWASYAATGKVTVDTIAANYDLGMAKVSASYFRRTADAPLSTPTTPDASGYSVGLAVPVGAATFKAGVMNNSKTDLLLDRTSYGVDYALSKRTTLIAEYARDKRALSGDSATNNYYVGVYHSF